MAEIVTKCPCCGGDIVEREKFFGCTKWNDEQHPCDFVIWKTISKKKIKTEQVIDICTNGKSLLINGFVSKAGKPFSAFLVISDAADKKCGKRISFEFPERNREGE